MRVVHIVAVESGEIVFRGSKVNDAIAYTPAQAVQVLRQFPHLVLSVPITSTSAKELLSRWQSGNDSEPASLRQQLMDAYLNQSGEMLLLPRELVANVIDSMEHTQL